MSNLSFMEKLLDGVTVEWKALGDVAEYSPTRVDAAELDATSFVGVDNLVADKGGRVDASYLPNTARLTAYEPGDILIGNTLLVELKSVEKLAPVHSKQVLTYLRLLNLPLGLLINFGAATFKEGCKRIVNGKQDFVSSCLRVNQKGATE